VLPPAPACENGTTRRHGPLHPATDCVITWVASGLQHPVRSLRNEAIRDHPLPCWTDNRAKRDSSYRVSMVISYAAEAGAARSSPRRGRTDCTSCRLARHPDVSFFRTSLFQRFARSDMGEASKITIGRIRPHFSRVTQEIILLMRCEEATAAFAMRGIAR